MLLYTAGYEGVDIATFIQRLQDAGVNQIIDVRKYPISRKRGFSKTALSQRLAEASIAYRHMPQLGCPKPIRERYKRDGDWSAYEDDFVKYIATQRDTLNQVLAEARTTFSCLICFEADASFCHRRLVAEASKEIQPRLTIDHLTIKKEAVAAL